MNIITPEQATAIARARVALREIAQTTRTLACDASIDLGCDRLSLGRFAEAVDNAEDKLFDMLNVAQAHLRDEIAEETVLFQDVEGFLGRMHREAVAAAFDKIWNPS